MRAPPSDWDDWGGPAGPRTSFNHPGSLLSRPFCFFKAGEETRNDAEWLSPRFSRSR
jgi:hypothetical protein